MSKVWLTTKSRQQLLRQAGFSVVELLLAVTIFGMLTSGLIGAVVYGRGSSDNATDHNKAYQLAEEGLDAARNMGNSSYALLTLGNHGLLQSAGQWSFNGLNDTTGIYTRTVNVASAGTNRLLVTSTVTWNVTGATDSVVLTTRIVNWEAAIKQWSAALNPGLADATGTNAGLKVATQGNYAYMVRNATTSNFAVFNISTTTPSLVVSTSFSNTPADIAVSGNYAYVVTNTSSTGLEIIDISNPASPTLAKAVTLAGSVASKGLRGGR